VSKLSGGWKRRVNIAIALIHSPQIIIMDEPTAGLDMEARYELWDLIRSLKDDGVSVLLTTHQLEEAERLCSKIGIMKNGSIAAEGSLNELQKLVPAKQLVVIETANTEPLKEKAELLDWGWRPYGKSLVLYMNERSTLNRVVNDLDNATLMSISLQEVGLEHIYMEVTRDW
jgi:ABC-2 type transport system ATP-binding protein